MTLVRVSEKNAWCTVTVVPVIEPSQRWIVPALGEKLRATGMCGTVGVHLDPGDALKVSWRRGQDPARRARLDHPHLQRTTRGARRGMRSEISERHNSDEQGRPAGGQTTGKGFVIHWQDGPLAVDGVRREPNGAFVEDIIAAAIGRIEYYQSTQFASEYNAEALRHLRGAAEALDNRTKDREARGVEGTHQL